MKPRVIVGPAPMRDIPHAFVPVLEPRFEVVFPLRKAQMTEAELLAQLPGCVASLAGSEPYTRKAIEVAAAAGLKVIARAGVGYDGIDVQAATDNNVLVTYAPGSNHEAVGEHALLLMLALSKALLMQHRETVAGRWPRVAQQPLRGRTLGIIGLGRTGKAVATRALAFGMTVIAADPYVDDTFAKAHGIRLTSQEDVFRTADIVTLHVPLTPETRNLVNAGTLSLMKPSAYLVNTARGEVVNEADLFAALSAKKIAAAGLDVFEHEPLVGSPLQTLDNVILTAHTAGVDVRSREDMVNFAAQAIAKLFAGEWPTEWIVNPGLKGTWRAA